MCSIELYKTQKFNYNHAMEARIDCHIVKSGCWRTPLQNCKIAFFISFGELAFLQILKRCVMKAGDELYCEMKHLDSYFKQGLTRFTNRGERNILIL